MKEGIWPKDAERVRGDEMRSMYTCNKRFVASQHHREADRGRAVCLLSSERLHCIWVHDNNTINNKSLLRGWMCDGMRGGENDAGSRLG